MKHLVLRHRFQHGSVDDCGNHIPKVDHRYLGRVGTLVTSLEEVPCPTDVEVRHPLLKGTLVQRNEKRELTKIKNGSRFVSVSLLRRCVPY